MGLLTGVGGIINAADVEEEYRGTPAGGEIVIADGEWQYKGNTDIASSGKKPVNIRSQSGINNCLIKTEGSNYLYFENSDLIRFMELSFLCTGGGSGGGNAIRFGTGFSHKNTNLAVGLCNFKDYGQASGQHGAITTRGFSNGLIYESLFDNYSVRTGDHYAIQHDGNNVYTRDTAKWLSHDTGFDYLLVIDGCEFMNCQHSIASDRGASYLMRRCDIHRNQWGQAIDAHGGDGSASNSHVLAIICNNKVYDPRSGGEKGICIRGGQAIVHDNDVSGYSSTVEMTLEPNVSGSSRLLDMRVHDTYIWNNPGRVSVWGVRQGYNSPDYIREGTEYFLHAPASSVYTPFGEHPLRTGTTPTPDPEPEPEPEPETNVFKVFLNDVEIFNSETGFSSDVTVNINT